MPAVARRSAMRPAAREQGPARGGASAGDARFDALEIGGDRRIARRAAEHSAQKVYSRALAMRYAATSPAFGLIAAGSPPSRVARTSSCVATLAILALKMPRAPLSFG